MANKNNPLQKFKSYDWSRLALELIVVFLGITSGFFLNNWQLQQEEKENEQKYISGFLEDVNFNIPELESAIEDDSNWLARIVPKLPLIKDRNIEIDSAIVVMQLITGISRMELHIGTYESIKNSGNLNIISNFKLKNKIVDYHISIHGIGFIDDYFYKYFGDFVMPFIFEEFSILRGEFNNKNIIKAVKYSNVVTGYFAMVQQRITAYKELLIESNSLRNELEVNIIQKSFYIDSLKQTL